MKKNKNLGTSRMKQTELLLFYKKETELLAEHITIKLQPRFWPLRESELTD